MPSKHFGPLLCRSIVKVSPQSASIARSRSKPLIWWSISSSTTEAVERRRSRFRAASASRAMLLLIREISMPDSRSIAEI